MRISFNDEWIHEIEMVTIESVTDDEEGVMVQLLTKPGLWGHDKLEVIGEWNLLETTKEAALANWRKIFTQILEKGYCKDSDFEHFVWY